MKNSSDIQQDRIEARSTGFEDDDVQKPMARHGAKEMAVESTALADAVAKDNPDFRSSSQIKLYFMMALCVLNGIMNGFDGSVISAINAMEPFQDRFQIGRTGNLNGAVFSIYTVGSILGSLGCGYIMDRWGRRTGMFTGAFFIVLGSVLQASAYQLPQFMVGRLIVGFGNPMCATTAAVYIVELAYPTWRGLAGGLYNVVGWNVGANSKSFSKEPLVIKVILTYLSGLLVLLRHKQHQERLGMAHPLHHPACLPDYRLHPRVVSSPRISPLALGKRPAGACPRHSRQITRWRQP